MIPSQWTSSALMVVSCFFYLVLPPSAVFAQNKFYLNPDDASYDKVEAFYQERLSDIIEITKEPIFNLTPGRLKPLLKPLMGHPDIRAVRILDHFHDIPFLVVWKLDGEIKLLLEDNFPEESFLSSYRKLSAPLKWDGVLLGEVELFVNKVSAFQKNQLINRIDFSDAEIAYLDSNPVVKIIRLFHEPPFVLTRNREEPDGYMYDLLGYIFGALKIDIEYIDGGNTFTSMIETVESGQADIVPMIEKNHPLSEDSPMVKSASVIITPFVLMGNAQQSKPIDHYEELFHQRVAVVEGFIQDKYLSQFPEIEKVHVNNTDSGYEAVRYGKADYFLNNRANAEYAINKNVTSDMTILGELSYSAFPPLVVSFGIDSRKRILRSLLNKALDAVSLNEMRRIKDKWFLRKQHALSGTLTPEEKAYLKRKGPILLGIKPTWKPIEWLNERGIHKGIAADIIQLVSKLIDHPIKVIPTKRWIDTMSHLKTGQCEMVSAVVGSRENSELMLFTSPYLKLDLVIATRSDHAYIQNMNVMHGQKVAVVRNSVAHNVLESHYPKIEVVPVNDLDAGLRMLGEGKIIGVIDNLISLAFSIQHDGYGDVKISGHLDESLDLCMGVRTDDPMLFRIIEKAVSAIPDEAGRRFINRQIAVKFEQKTDYTIMWRVLVAVSGILLFLLYRNKVLHRTNSEVRAVNEKLKAAQEELKRLAITDRLTGLFNRAKLDEALEREFKRSRRYQSSFGVILLDIDFFKRVNDTHGHQTGDKILIAFAELLLTQIRESDLVGRWGGEEFMILCFGVQETGAKKFAEHLRQAVAEHNFSTVQKVTASFGVAYYRLNDTSESVERIVARADTALYEAKNRGRNRVEMVR